MAKEGSNKKRKSTCDDSEPKEETTSTVANNATSTKKKKKSMKSNGSSTSVESSSNSSSSATTAATTNDATTFKPFDLSQIQASVAKLMSRIPTVPETGIDPHNETEVRAWSMSMQAVIEEFNLLLTCISAATYKWGSDRTGAGDQNLSLLSNELGNAQEQISSGVTPRLTNVLAPVVDLVTKETIVRKEKDEKTGEVYERRINHFSREKNDPDFIHLCHIILCRNAVMMRHVVLTNFHKVEKCINDYLKATKKDNGNHNRSAFY
mmetsp:Transcript_6140/g.9287  ORF Transcript_6140/g.9287 Transcript_6140/m.9287 type:complete len:265 (+) Transcript_6140:3385-4179(+)